MNELVRLDLRDLPTGERCHFIRLDAPRANALEPGLLDALQSALDAVIDSGVRRVVLSGGRNFSTGGDVGRFHDAAESGEVLEYANAVVPRLQECVYRMMAAPVIFAVAARGAITGGSAGFLFAADLSVLCPEAFVQPYYGTVGFAPDGGWTAVLPDLIGTSAARNWLLTDRRVSAGDAVGLGIAATVDDDPESRCAEFLARIDIDSALATKRLIWNAERLSRVRDGLSRETAAFCSLIGSDIVKSRMARFLGREEAAGNV
ncbi:enoyl-CoA hydratase/isomerase family protein [Pacificispira sp.]|uniref:enoyl-CoA hydratase/isomerase family protein n=1 Tax=Pacificispira sp. TaxID=2888761 RepID=UPI003BACB866